MNHENVLYKYKTSKLDKTKTRRKFHRDIKESMEIKEQQRLVDTDAKQANKFPFFRSTPLLWALLLRTDTFLARLFAQEARGSIKITESKCSLFERIIRTVRRPSIGRCQREAGSGTTRGRQQRALLHSHGHDLYGWLGH
ncbi:hypothetical protein BaRGS_00019970 [Batillaria attramentaria]|uniref:Uncharacterized protein n=1 Tax=Batillaria attramentaria TaxID=370345 RepID=A0ABD0KNM9_9CAEN